MTGKTELTFVDEQWELNTGKQAYGSYRQSQGGDYVVDPQVEEYVNEVGQRLAAVSDRELPYEFNVLNNSVPNAWALPGGKIAVNRGLLTELNSEAELAAVLSHEIVHAAARHGAQAQTRGIGSQLLVLGAAIGAGPEYGQVAQIGAQLVNQKYGRDDELESDQYGMLYMSRAGYDPDAAIDLQETFVRLSDGQSSDWLSGLFASHPPSAQRVAKNIETAKTLPQDGDSGEQRYKQALHTLFEKKPAYDAYDQAVEAANEGDFGKATALLETARQIEPREALFDVLEGDLAAAQGNTSRAIESYNQALAANPELFIPLAKRGALEYEMGNRQAARRDLERSMALMPGYDLTHYTLGRISLDDGNHRNAIRHFQAASKSNSEIGKQSFSALLNLDLPQNPQKYIQARVARANNGELIVRIANTTSVPIGNIVVGIQIFDTSGRASNRRRGYRGILGPGKQATIRTGIGASNVSRADVYVYNARIAAG